VSSEKPSALKTELKAHGKILGGVVGFMWAVFFVNLLVFQGHLTSFGVQPRTLSGLFGILLAPFLHVDLAHLVSNTVPMLVLGWFVMLRRKRDLLYVSLLSALVGGLGTWLIGPAASVHVGASVLVFGYLGYLLLRGILERKFWSIAGSLAVFFLYGGVLFGVLPGNPGVSWQGHLFGLLGGLGAARLLATSKTGAKPKAATKELAPKVRVAPSAPPPRARLLEAAPEAEDSSAELEALKKRMARRPD
jgi:membrane associated rhomboid family serine protease